MPIGEKHPAPGGIVMGRDLFARDNPLSAKRQCNCGVVAQFLVL